MGNTDLSEEDQERLNSNLQRVGAYLLKHHKSDHVTQARDYTEKRDITSSIDLSRCSESEIEMHILDTVGKLYGHSGVTKAVDTRSLDYPTYRRDREVSRKDKINFYFGTSQRDFEQNAQEKLKEINLRKKNRIEQEARRSPAQIYAGAKKVAQYFDKTYGPKIKEYSKGSATKHPYTESMQDLIARMVAKAKGLKYRAMPSKQLNSLAVKDMDAAFPNGVRDMKTLLGTSKEVKTPEELNALTNPRYAPSGLYKIAKHVALIADEVGQEDGKSSRAIISKNDLADPYNKSVRYLLGAMVCDLKRIEYDRIPSDQIDPKARQDISRAFPNGLSDMKTLLKTSKSPKTVGALTALTAQRHEIKARGIARLQAEQAERAEYKRNEDALVDSVLELDKQGYDGLAMLEYDVAPPAWIMVKQGEHSLTFKFPRAVFNENKDTLAEHGITEAPYMPLRHSEP